VARKFLTDIELLGFALLNARLHPTSSDPSGLGAGDEGRVWVNTTTHKLKYWNGTAAIDLLDLTNSTGSLTASRISDFNTAVRTSRPDQLATNGADLNLGGFKITALADGVAGTDAASYGQVLALINNRAFKDPVRVATTANITSLAGGAPNTLDGVSLAASDRILVKDQSTGAQNGIYVVSTLGTGANGTWTRATDADSAAELPPGAIISVQEGTAGADKLFMLATNGPITIGSTSLTFSAYGASSGEIGVAGAGLTKTGTTYDVGAGTGITVAADSVAVDTGRVVRKWVGGIPNASGTVDSIGVTVSGAVVTFNHGTGNSCPRVTIRIGATPPAAGGSTGQLVEVDDVATDNNNVQITLPAAPATGNYTFMVEA
jgi:hypothetical protein